MLRTLFRPNIYISVRAASASSSVKPSNNIKRKWAKPSRKVHDENYSFLHVFPSQFLRDSDFSDIDERTSQRNNVHFDTETGKPNTCLRKISFSERCASIEKYVIDQSNGIKIYWSDGVWTQHDKATLKEQFLSWKMNRSEYRIHWENLTENDVRNSSDFSISFSSLVLGDESGISRAIKSLYSYGILLVTNTPVHDNGVGIAALGAALSGGSVKSSPAASILANYRLGGTEVVLPSGTDGPLRTLYGGVWATTSDAQPNGTSTADSSFGNDALPLHTDMTYLQDPPGLQIFTMVQPALVGGESVFCDGFALAETLRNTDPVAFTVLSETSRFFRSQDNANGWYLKATGPVIQIRDGHIIGIRHNDLDRLPDLPPNDVVKIADIHSLYTDIEHAHKSWDSLIAEDKFRLVMKLDRGDTMVVANQRCMHGRYSFKSIAHSPRSVMGCYISQDDLSSRFRMEGYNI